MPLPAGLNFLDVPSVAILCSPSTGHIVEAKLWPAISRHWHCIIISLYLDRTRLGWINMVSQKCNSWVCNFVSHVLPLYEVWEVQKHKKTC